MNKQKILNAIDEGIRSSLINFGNSTILKSNTNDNELMFDKLKKDIDIWMSNDDASIPSSLYNELCKNKYIGFYEVYSYLDIGRIAMNLSISHIQNINLNWIDISNVPTLYNALSDIAGTDNKFTLDISMWPINELAERMFRGSKDMVNIMLPNIKKIGPSSFHFCTDLQSIDLPASVTYIDDLAFCNCNDLEKITINSNNISYIGDGAFFECFKLKTIDIPVNSTMTSINRSAFAECNSLKEFLIPNNVTSIGYKAFYNCFSLEKITIPSTVKSIEEVAFENCLSLKDIIFDGTREQWNDIESFCSFNEINDNCTVHCTDGDYNIIFITFDDDEL